jgi:cytochrome c2
VCLGALGVATIYYPATFQVVDVERGRTLFQQNCASCHSFEPRPGSSAGPSLISIGAVAAKRISGMSAEEYLLESIVDPARYQAAPEGTMPQRIAQQFSKADLGDLIAFLMQHGGAVDYRSVLGVVEQTPLQQATAVETLNLASIENGKEYFHGRGQCGACHNFDESPGNSIGAPSLLLVGLNSREYLERAVCQPDAQILEGYRQYSVNCGGVPVTGRRLPSKSGSVRLLVAEPTGGWNVREFATSELEPFDDGSVVQALATSPMPKLDAWRADELSALIDFLLTLR